ncbi:MAG: bifunctional folylpolyglutamate synthase/dihydrofolate synthase [Lachnospiraceae bacterium]|nr:bifunctional folylpolyglutamate synthase/dihydrofolate synthase [Lachnospiraceae bacterium]
MKYEEALEYLSENVNPLGSVLGLEGIRELLNRIGNPQNDLRVIHVAGTNGKGSVSSFVASMLRENGYRVGRYLSPAVLDYREKIQVNGSYIPKTKVAEYLSMLFKVCKEMVGDGLAHPTSFEVETAMAFLYLKEKKCDFCIIEVGMGGAEDATNVFDFPHTCVITSISEDHLGMIGNSVEEIAKTKAGIIKDGCKVVIAPQGDSVKEAIQNTCTGLKNVDFHYVSPEDISVKYPKASDGSGKFTLKRVKISYKTYKNTEIALVGDCQIENAAVALEVIDSLRGEVPLKDEKIKAGLAKTEWPCRFELLGSKPAVIADGAHNPDAVLKLMKTADYYFTNRPIIYIMGVLKDKDVKEMIRLSAAKANVIITVTPPDNKRGMKAFELAGMIREINENVSTADSVEEALEVASLFAGENGVILAFGSLSYLGRLRRAYETYSKKK